MAAALRSLSTTALTVLVLATGVGACAPALRAAGGMPASRAIALRYLAVWVVSDSAHNLFNVRLSRRLQSGSVVTD